MQSTSNGAATETAKTSQAKAIADSMDVVFENSHSLLGFHRGRLYYFGGRSLKPVTIKESIRIYAKMLKEVSDGDEILDNGSVDKWLKMVAAAVR